MLLKIFILLTILILNVSAYTTVKVPKNLGLYYGWPSLVQNSQGDVTKATTWFQKFDLLVFGDGIWSTTHGDHNKTTTITRNLVASNKRVFGYVDLGVTTQNLSVAQMQQAVNGWALMGATGIFWDDAGTDFNVSRSRQIGAIQLAHSKGMNVIMNAWNPDDVLSGPNVTLNASDIYLLESYLSSYGAYQSLTEWKTKADKCANYQKTLGVQIACLATTLNCDQYTQAWFGTAIYNFDYFQAAEATYSAITNSLQFTVAPSASYGTYWQNDTISPNGDSTSFSRSTNSWKLLVNGDGYSWGYGTFNSV